MYKLYINKEIAELRIEPIGILMADKSKITNTPSRFNNSYMVCSDRKVLKQKAEEIKMEWVREAEELLEKYNNVKIKVKY